MCSQIQRQISYASLWWLRLIESFSYPLKLCILRFKVLLGVDANDYGLTLLQSDLFELPLVTLELWLMHWSDFNNWLEDKYPHILSGLGSYSLFLFVLSYSTQTNTLTKNFVFRGVGKSNKYDWNFVSPKFFHISLFCDWKVRMIISQGENNNSIVKWWTYVIMYWEYPWICINLLR